MNAEKNKMLNRDDVKAIFAEEFDEEFAAFEDNVRTVAKGNTGLANTWTDYLGLGAISVGTVLSNATFALLAGLKIISRFVPIGTGVALTATGLAVGIIFRKLRLKTKRQRYEDAELFLDNEMYADNAEKFKQTLFKHLYPAMRHRGRSGINEITKAVIEAVANLILHSKIETFEELNQANFREMLQDSVGLKSGFAVNTKVIMRVMNDLSVDEVAAMPVVDKQEEAVVLTGGAAASVLGAQTLFASNTMQEEGPCDSVDTVDSKPNDSLVQSMAK